MRNHGDNDFSESNDVNGDVDINVSDNSDVSTLGVSIGRKLDPNQVEVVSNEEDEERDLILLQAAKHIKVARAHRALYQASGQGCQGG